MENFAAPPLAPAGFKDRKTGLVIFGILEILGGVLVGLMVPLFIAGALFNQQKTGAKVELQTLAMIALFYGGLALTLICLGVGSIRARRWARALSLILAWSALIMGVFLIGGMLLMCFTRPETAGMPGIVFAVILLIQSFIFLLIPAVGVWFYGSRHVKATCEARQPAPGWTDACPLPVLAVCLFIVLGASTLPVTALFRTAFPFFGIILSGVPATILSLALTVVWLYSAWKMYRLAISGWWIQFACMLGISMSSALTFSKHSMLEFYQAAGYTEQQLAQLEKSLQLTGGNALLWISGISCVLWLGYLLWIKKYFRKDARRAA